MSEELKPCPYCKGTYTCIQNVQTGGHQSTCCCGMTGPIMATEQEAAESWNALPRHADIERVERERDWLAAMLSEACARNGSCPFTHWHCGIKQLSCSSACVQDWLAAAKEATCQKN